jgi:hypothetical protein
VDDSIILEYIVAGSMKGNGTKFSSKNVVKVKLLESVEI